MSWQWRIGQYLPLFNTCIAFLFCITLPFFLCCGSCHRRTVKKYLFTAQLYGVENKKGHSIYKLWEIKDGYKFLTFLSKHGVLVPSP